MAFDLLKTFIKGILGGTSAEDSTRPSTQLPKGSDRGRNAPKGMQTKGETATARPSASSEVSSTKTRPVEMHSGEATPDAKQDNLNRSPDGATSRVASPTSPSPSMRSERNIQPSTDFAFATSQPSTREGAAPSVGNLYIDFISNADDNVDKKGRRYQGLRTQLTELHRTRPAAIFPAETGDVDLLTRFQDTFFAHAKKQTYLICNVSVRTGKPFLAIRPKLIGPRLEKLLPDGMSIAILGRLVDNFSDPNNPLFQAQRVRSLSASEARLFEREIAVSVYTEPSTTRAASCRPNNVLTSDFIASLPLISISTQERLQEWRDYLDWKERLIKARLVGLRYLKVDLASDGLYKFLVVTESEEAFERFRNVLRTGDARAFGLSYSAEPWVYSYNERARERGVELGESAGFEGQASLADVDTQVIPWQKPFAAHLLFRLTEDDQNELDASLEAGDVNAAVTFAQDRLPPSGFLALSAVGDLALVSRQRFELENLQEQSGYAPFLSSYLFDIASANTPREAVVVADDKWFRSDLSDDQRNAVRKILSAPDLALLQGPPGTGKTTVIAEATQQFVNRGRKVLLVSQANLAVDNVLERLAQSPEMRAIRLGRKGEEDNPFSQTRVLETYYNAIALQCSRRTLDVWQQCDVRRNTLNSWIAATDLIVTDIAALQQLEADIASAVEAIRGQLAEDTAQRVRAREQEQWRRDVEGFLCLLDIDGTWSGRLPEEVVQTFVGYIAEPLDSLQRFGIRVNRAGLRLDQGTLAEKGKCCAEIMREWWHIAKAVPQLEADLVRLRIAGTDLVLAQPDAVQLEELERRLHDVQRAMEDDAALLPEWQRIQKEVREVRRRGSGLDRALYERIFCGSAGDIGAHEVFTDPAAKRSKVVLELEGAITGIQEAIAAVSEGSERVREAASSYLRTLDAASPEQGTAHLPEGKLKQLSTQLEDATSQREAKQLRLEQMMKERAAADGLPGEWLQDAFPRLRDLIYSQLQALEKQNKDATIFREAWEPTLGEWVADLRRAETLRDDQVNVLPTYIAATNVVGITCTESRRTLEEAGHTRFDAVIVDEVSKATPPELLFPMMMARTAILVGDHRQLPPLFKEKGGSWEEVLASAEEGAEGGAARAVSASDLTAENFDRFQGMVTASLFKEHFEKAPDALKAFLFTQYRMHPQIMSVVNRFYENRLRCGLVDPDAELPDSDQRGHRVHKMTLLGTKGDPYLTPEQHVLWIDSTTDPAGVRHNERHDPGASKANDLEAVLIAKVLVDIEVACRLQGYGENGKALKQVGVITFYERQVRELRKTVGRLKQLRGIQFTAIRVDVNTVDRYQGQERPIVLVSMVRNPPWKLSPRANTAQFERINVAFSRAQELLVVVGAKDVFTNYPVNLPHLDRPGRENVDVYRHIIEDIQRGGGLWKSQEIVSQNGFDELLPKTKGRRIQK